MPTKIEWATEVFNPVTGCTPISPGCANCYAERMSKRLAGRCGYPADEPFRVTVHPDRMEEPLRWKKPRRVFVCSMGDLFHPDVSFEFIDKVFAVMALCPQHTFLILTKRPDRMRRYLTIVKPETATQDWRRHLYFASGNNQRLSDGCCFKWPLPNVRLGVTTENQEQANKRIPILLQTPAAVRFVSVEPMLGPVDLSEGMCERGWWCDYCQATKSPQQVTSDELCTYCGGSVEWKEQIDWVVCGTESGPRRRPAKIEWIRNLRDQCIAANIPFFLKQAESCGQLIKMPELDGRTWAEMPEVE